MSWQPTNSSNTAVEGCNDCAKRTPPAPSALYHRQADKIAWLWTAMSRGLR